MTNVDQRVRSTPPRAAKLHSMMARAAAVASSAALSTAAAAADASGGGDGADSDAEDSDGEPTPGYIIPVPSRIEKGQFRKFKGAMAAIDTYEGDLLSEFPSYTGLIKEQYSILRLELKLQEEAQDKV